MFHINPDGQNKKHLLRNPEDRLPEVRIEQNPPLVTESSKSKLDESEVEVSQVLPPKAPKANLTIPKLNSVLCIEKKIKETEDKKAKKIKKVSDLGPPERVSYDEKITKQMNYPFDKKLYKKLISLHLSKKTEYLPPSTSFGPALKDRVPNLEDYFTPPPNFEYSIPVKSNLGGQTATRQYDGLRMDKVMRTWKENRPD